MYWKLAIQNIRRSLRDYIIYFVTLTLTAALMYSFLALGFSSDVIDGIIRYQKIFTLSALVDDRLCDPFIGTTENCGIDEANSFLALGFSSDVEVPHTYQVSFSPMPFLFFFDVWFWDADYPALIDLLYDNRKNEEWISNHSAKSFEVLLSSRNG